MGDQPPKLTPLVSLLLALTFIFLCVWLAGAAGKKVAVAFGTLVLICAGTVRHDWRLQRAAAESLRQHIVVVAF